MELTRDSARKAWAASGMTIATLSRAALEDLRFRINEELRRDRPIRGFCVRARPIIRETALGRWADLRCSAHYFTDRQAVTFEREGFVGFAGWADDRNVQPILRAFVAWVSRQSETKAAAV